MTRRGALLLFLALPGDGLVYTHLGINGQLWEFAGGARVLVDPVLVGDLTFFGAPALYSARAATAADDAGRRAPPPPQAALFDRVCRDGFDALLISQGWEDHAHPPTLAALAARGALRGVTVVAPPAALATVERAARDGGARARALDHGEAVTLAAAGAAPVTVRCRPGALLGPPWAKRENAYVVLGGGEPAGGGIYYEPHGEWGGWPAPPLAAEREHVGVVITPCASQSLAPLRRGGPAFPLVKGESLARALDELRPTSLVPLANGDLDAAGFAAQFVRAGEPAASEATMPAGVAFVRAPLGEPVVVQ